MNKGGDDDDDDDDDHKHFEFKLGQYL